MALLIGTKSSPESKVCPESKVAPAAKVDYPPITPDKLEKLRKKAKPAPTGSQERRDSLDTVAKQQGYPDWYTAVAVSRLPLSTAALSTAAPSPSHPQPGAIDCTEKTTT